MNPVLQDCIKSLEPLKSVLDCKEVAPILQKHLPELLATENLLTPEQHQYDPNKDYTKHEIFSCTDSESPWTLVAIVWNPNSETPIHDHCCWCTFGIYKGTLIEKRFKRSGDNVQETDCFKRTAGDFDSMTPDGFDIHKIINPTDEIAISLHFYGINTNLKSSSVKECYC